MEKNVASPRFERMEKYSARISSIFFYKILEICKNSFYTVTIDVLFYEKYLAVSSFAQSCKSGRAFRVGFGPGSGLKLTKISGFIRASDVLFVLDAQKYNQSNLARLLNFSALI